MGISKEVPIFVVKSFLAFKTQAYQYVEFFYKHTLNESDTGSSVITFREEEIDVNLLRCCQLSP